MKKINVGIFVFNHIELLDFTGPYEVFSVTTNKSEENLCNTFLIGNSTNQLVSVNGLKFLPDYSIDDHPDIDILVLPGGNGTKEEMFVKNSINWIKNVNKTCEYILSVCTGARLLASAGLLDELEYTTHHECFEELESICPKGKLNKNIRFTSKGKILTSGGISAGIDLSLHVVETLFGNEIKQKTMAYMEYGNWSI
ncbi:DJ-1/PfpI family protein [Leptospira sp. WS39.C2]